jgi:hypothetical protein
MQENRSFDHYFGTLRGVRGFADPHPMTLPSGKSVWHQPNGANDLLPFRPPVRDLGQTYLPDPPHGWNDGHAAWNGGKYDQWVPNKGVTTMTHHIRGDLPYHFALAGAFTVCDNYHCSLLGPTVLVTNRETRAGGRRGGNAPVVAVAHQGLVRPGGRGTRRPPVRVPVRRPSGNRRGQHQRPGHGRTDLIRGRRDRVVVEHHRVSRRVTRSARRPRRR